MGRSAVYCEAVGPRGVVGAPDRVRAGSGWRAAVDPGCVKTQNRAADIVSPLEDISIKVSGRITVHLTVLVAAHGLQSHRFQLILAHMQLRSFHTAWTQGGQNTRQSWWIPAQTVPRTTECTLCSTEPPPRDCSRNTWVTWSVVAALWRKV